MSSAVARCCVRVLSADVNVKDRRVQNFPVPKLGDRFAQQTRPGAVCQLGWPGVTSSERFEKQTQSIFGYMACSCCSRAQTEVSQTVVY
jgi:hypothetical protein